MYVIECVVISCAPCEVLNPSRACQSFTMEVMLHACTMSVYMTCMLQCWEHACHIHGT